MGGGGGGSSMLLGWVPFFLFSSYYMLSASVLHTCISCTKAFTLWSIWFPDQLALIKGVPLISLVVALLGKAY